MFKQSLWIQQLIEVNECVKTTGIKSFRNTMNKCQSYEKNCSQFLQVYGYRGSIYSNYTH